MEADKDGRLLRFVDHVDFQAAAEGAIRYFAAGLGRLRRREQPRSPIEFVSPVRSGAAVRPRATGLGMFTPSQPAARRLLP